jgi:hypothetical protein
VPATQVSQVQRDDILLAVFVAVEGAHAFSAFMPSTYTTLKFAGDPGDAAMLRMGYIPAVMFNLILGGIVSFFAKSKKPIVASLLVIVGMTMFYEWGIRKGTGQGFVSSGGKSANTGTQAAPQEAVGGTVQTYTGEMAEGSGNILFPFSTNKSAISQSGIRGGGNV